jgi:hypothetical protein
VSLLDFALQLGGFPQKTIADLDRQLPGLARLAAAVKEIEPDLTLAKPHLDALMPIAARLWPVLQKAWPDIVAVTPTVQELIDLANSRENQS